MEIILSTDGRYEGEIRSDHQAVPFSGTLELLKALEALLPGTPHPVPSSPTTTVSDETKEAALMSVFESEALYTSEGLNSSEAEGPSEHEWSWRAGVGEQLDEVAGAAWGGEGAPVLELPVRARIVDGNVGGSVFCAGP